MVASIRGRAEDAGGSGLSLAFTAPLVGGTSSEHAAASLMPRVDEKRSDQLTDALCGTELNEDLPNTPGISTKSASKSEAFLGGKSRRKSGGMRRKGASASYLMPRAASERAASERGEGGRGIRRGNVFPTARAGAPRDATTCEAGEGGWKGGIFWQNLPLVSPPAYFVRIYWQNPTEAPANV